MVIALPVSAEELEQEIVVTAERRSESVQEAPVAVSTFSRAYLQDSGKINMDQVARDVPNVDFSFGSDFPSFNRVSIRGFTTDTFNPGLDPTVAFFLDGVYLARIDGIAFDLDDIDRIEVLRGPEGTLYGKDSAGGAVNIYSLTPTNAPSGEIDVRFGDYDLRRVSAYVSGPIIADKLDALVSVFHDERNGFAENLFTGKDIGSVDDSGLRLKFLVRPADGLQVTISGDYHRNFSNGFPAAADILNRQPVDIYDYQVDKDTDESNSLSSGGVTGTIDYTLPDAVTLTSISAYRKVRFGFDGYDIDFTPAPDLAESGLSQQHQFSEELRAVTPTGAEVELTGGLYFLKSNSYNDEFLDVPIYAPYLNLHTLFDQVATDYAAYGQASYRPLDDLKLTAGLRYGLSTKTADFVQAASGSFGLFYPLIRDLQDSRADHSVNYTVSADYLFNPDWAVYAKIADGTNAGGFNGLFLTSTDFLSFKPEHATNYEVGVKANGLGPKLSFSLDAFYTSFDDLQVSAYNGAGIFLTNAASAVSKGIEFEAASQPLAGLTLHASVGYDLAVYDSYPAGPVPNSSTMVADLSGGALPYAPHWTTSLTAQYERAVTSKLSAFIRGEYSAKTGQNLTPDLDPNTFQAGYQLANGRFGIRSEDGWSAQLFAENLFDERYKVQSLSIALSGGAGYDAYPGPPRTYGVELDYSF